MAGKPVAYEQLDDESLIRLVAQAQSEALSALYDRSSRLVYSVALHTTGDASLAEEITQEVFLRVWERAAAYRAATTSGFGLGGVRLAPPSFMLSAANALASRP